MDRELTFEDWVNGVPERMKSDPLWKSAYYKLSMYLYDLVWQDCEKLRLDFRGREIVGQITRSAGSICSNIEEGFGRGIGSQDFIRILRIALGEARETQGWYYRSRHVFPPELIERRIAVVNQIIALLVNTIAHQRQKLVKT